MSGMACELWHTGYGIIVMAYRAWHMSYSILVMAYEYAMANMPGLFLGDFFLFFIKLVTINIL